MSLVEDRREPILNINRSVYNQKKFDDEFKSDQPAKNKKNSPAKHIKNFINDYHPKNILNLFTILNLISEYNFKNYLIPYTISGITVSLLFY